MLSSRAEKEADTCADKQGWSKNTADCAGTKCGRRSEHFEKQNGSERLPNPVTLQNAVYDTVAVAADLGIKHSECPDNQTADTHLQGNRHRNLSRPVFAHLQ